MNERIVKLITEANVYASTIAEKYVPECGEVNYLWEHAFRKKFAELIVRECINEIHGADVGDLKGRGYYLDKVAEHIENHFGVE